MFYGAYHTSTGGPGQMAKFLQRVLQGPEMIFPFNLYPRQDSQLRCGFGGYERLRYICLLVS